MVSKVCFLDFPYLPAVNDLTVDLLSDDGVTVVQSDMACSDTGHDPGTYSFTVTAVLGGSYARYQSKVYRAGSLIGSCFFDLKETAGSYWGQVNPTAQTLGTTLTPIIQSAVQTAVAGGVNANVTSWNGQPVSSIPAEVPVTSGTSTTQTIIRGTTFQEEIALDRDPSTASKAWFTAKKRLTLSDAQAQIQIELGVGLTVLNGEAPDSPSGGSLTFDGNDAVVHLAPEVTAELDLYEMEYDVKGLFGTETYQMVRGKVIVRAAVTQSNS